MAEALLSGVVGHRIDEFGAWLPQMSFRYAAQDIAPDALLHQLDLHRSRGLRERPINVAVLVHGLFCDEQNWTLGPEPLADAVAPMFGWTPLLVRYNAGQHISHNGAALADLLEQLADAWGPRLGHVQLIGHSMGGLVSRAALAALERRKSPLLNRVERLFLLGVPNHGAELERLGHTLEVALGRSARLPNRGLRLFRGTTTPRVQDGSPMSNWLANTASDAIDAIWLGVEKTATAPLLSAQSLVQMRSDGIRDVRYGYMQAEEWQMDTRWNDRFWVSHKRPLPPPKNVATYAVAGSLMPLRGARPSRLRNDGLVSVASAAGTGGPFDDLQVVERDCFAEVPMLMHQIMPSSSRVRAQMRAWVSRDTYRDLG